METSKWLDLYIYPVRLNTSNINYQIACQSLHLYCASTMCTVQSPLTSTMSYLYTSFLLGILIIEIEI